MARLPNFKVVSHKAPRRVVMNTQGGSYELPPLGAAWLAGQLVAAALELLNEEGRLGVSSEEFSPVILWENWGREDGASWTPQFLHTVREVNREIARCRAEGIPYHLTVDLVQDPLNPPVPKD